jgi:thiazole biosynthesis enzyme
MIMNRNLCNLWLRKEPEMIETDISRVIIEQYTRRLSAHLENDVVIVGGGPAGLAAGYYLAKEKVKTTVVEKKLSIGGGIWGGAAGYNVVTFEDKEILSDIGVRTKKQGDLYIADAIEFAAGLAYKAKRAGAEIFNLIEAEDIVLKQETVKGIVVNSASARALGLHVDPFCIGAKYVIDATGHPAELVGMLKTRMPERFPKELQEYFMDVETSEAGVVEKTSEVFPGLYVAGMAVCDVFNLPRMGPIFGGMLKSGKKVAELINERL